LGIIEGYFRFTSGETKRGLTEKPSAFAARIPETRYPQISQMTQIKKKRI
jgi:hypothetical protein